MPRIYKKTKLIYGIVVNDADYVVDTTRKGKHIICPYYQIWHAMMTRCYSKKFHDDQPTYIGCTVCKKWLSFMAFRAWMEHQDWQGNHLDKDIIIQGNKIYSPTTCSFISHHTNTLLISCTAARGLHPRGVYWDKPRGKYQSEVSVNGKKIHLGRFDTPQEAHRTYRNAKAIEIRRHAAIQSDLRISDGLIRWAELFESNEVLP